MLNAQLLPQTRLTMADKSDIFLAKIKQERDRQQTLPGSEFDGENSVNDWIAIAGHYLNEPAVRRSSASFNRGRTDIQEEFEDCLIKAAAVILAALEYSDALKKSGKLL